MKKLTYITTLVLPLLLFIACSSKPQQPEKWSIRMANSVMMQYDTLTQYLGAAESRKWQYDVAMLGGAIAKLHTIDPKYSEYLKRYVDAFVNDDATVKRYKLEEYNIDRINPAKNLFTLYKLYGEEKYKNALPQFALQRDLYDPSTIRALVDAAFIVRPAAHGNRLLPSLYFTPRPVDKLLVI